MKPKTALHWLLEDDSLRPACNMGKSPIQPISHIYLYS